LQLGQDDVADLLAISLSSVDYVIHSFGPNSQEAIETIVQTDRALARFFRFLDRWVPGGLQNTVIVLTADHGGCPNPGSVSAKPYELPAGRVVPAKITSAITRELDARYGPLQAPETWFAHGGKPAQSGEFMEGLVYLNPDVVSQLIEDKKAGSAAEVEQTACEAVNRAAIEGVYRCYGKTEILKGQLPDHDIAARLSKAIDPRISGDLVVIMSPYYLDGPTGGYATSHGSPYLYDTHVPLMLCAPGLVKPGVYVDDVSPSGIAPTLSLLLRIGMPSGCDGQPLFPALMP
jgi:arylsulfatase A-like enzyme